VTANELPTSDQALVLADGTTIDPTTGEIIGTESPTTRYVELPTESEASRLVTRVRLSIADLPAPPEQMNAISVVIMYTIMGLSEIDISIVAGMTVSQIEHIKMLSAFEEAYGICVSSVMERDTQEVNDLLQRASKGAARRIAEMVNSPNEAASFAASKDVLDRSGHRPVDVVEHRHRLDGDLRITHIKRDESTTAPTLEVS
jgi:hypothetical protein